MHLQARRHLVGDHRTLDHALGQRLRHLRHGHAHRHRPHGVEHPGDGGCRAAQLEALEVLHLGHRLVLGEDHARAVHVDGQQLDVLVLVHRVLLHEIPGRTAGGRGVRHHEGQFEDLRAQETTRGVARDRPDDIGHTVLGLIEQLRRGSAQLHGREDLTLQPVAGVLGDGAAPVGHHGGVLDRLRTQEVVHLQHDGRLGMGGDRGHHTDGKGQGLEQGFHQ